MSTKQNGFDTDGIAGNFSIMTLHLDDWKIVLIWRCLHYTIYTKNLENDKSDQFWKYPHWHQSSSSSSSCWQWGDSWNISHTIFAIFLFVAVGSFAGDGGVLEPTGSVNLKSSVFAVWISTRDSNRSEIEEIETTRIVERVERPSQQNRVIENCIDAGFLSTVHVGQYFMTEDTEEFSQFTESVACRQHILRKGQQLFDPKGWIRRRTKIGPVLEVITSCVVPIVEDHGLILSWKFLRIARHGHLLREEDGAIPLIHDNVFVQTILSSICITSDVQSIHSIVNSGWFWDAHLVSKCGRSWSKPALIQRMNQQIQPRRTRTHDTGRLYCSVLKLSVLENTCSASVPCTSMRDIGTSHRVLPPVVGNGAILDGIHNNSSESPHSAVVQTRVESVAPATFAADDATDAAHWTCMRSTARRASGSGWRGLSHRLDVGWLTATLLPNRRRQRMVEEGMFVPERLTFWDALILAPH